MSYIGKVMQTGLLSGFKYARFIGFKNETNFATYI